MTRAVEALRASFCTHQQEECMQRVFLEELLEQWRKGQLTPKEMLDAWKGDAGRLDGN